MKNINFYVAFMKVIITLIVFFYDGFATYLNVTSSEWKIGDTSSNSTRALYIHLCANNPRLDMNPSVAPKLIG